MHAPARSIPLAFALVIACACNKTEPPVPSGEGFGCVNIVANKDFSCTEVDATSTQEERERFEKACVDSGRRNLRGRVVRHCPSESVVAECALPAEKSTMRYYEKEMSPEARKGAALGCKLRAGVFSERP